jgi:hypothetical protein
LTIPTTTYRVVGVRHGGERIKLADGLTLDRAEYVYRVLSDLVAFRELVMEPDGDPSDATVPWRA